MSKYSKKRRRIPMFGSQQHRIRHAGGAAADGTSKAGTLRSAAFTEPLTVAKGQTHTGEIASDGTVKVEGTIVGNVRANRVVVAATATVGGALIARTVHIDGNVQGRIDCSRLSIGPAARIVGDVEYDTLSISKGASISGHCLDRARHSAEPKIAYLTTPRKTEAALPFNVARAVFRKSRYLLGPAEVQPHELPGHARSMRAIWDSYQRNRGHS